MQTRATTWLRGGIITIGLLVAIIWKRQLGSGFVSRFDGAFNGLGDLHVRATSTIADAAVDVEFLGGTSEKLFLQMKHQINCHDAEAATTKWRAPE
jgi:hypothetical protein